MFLSLSYWSIQARASFPRLSLPAESEYAPPSGLVIWCCVNWFNCCSRRPVRKRALVFYVKDENGPLKRCRLLPLRRGRLFISVCVFRRRDVNLACISAKQRALSLIGTVGEVGACAVVRRACRAQFELYRTLFIRCLESLRNMFARVFLWELYEFERFYYR